MADKIATSRSIPSKMYIGRRRVNVIYNARTRGQVFPFAPPLPIIDDISPPSSALAGGTPVTITGAYFSSVSVVRFGSTSVPFEIVDSTTIRTTAPAGTGTVGVTVTNLTGVSNSFPFAYVAAAVRAGMNVPATWNATPYTTNTWQPILAGMVIRDGYPESVIEGDALVVSGGGPISGTFFGEYGTRLGTQQFRVVRIRNGETTVLETSNRGVAAAFTDVVMQGDRIMLECFYSTQYRNVTAATYVQFDPA